LNRLRGAVADDAIAVVGADGKGQLVQPIGKLRGKERADAGQTIWQRADPAGAGEKRECLRRYAGRVINC
jgi:hypothetical protein